MRSLLALALASCAHVGRIDVQLPTSRYPVSMTEHLVDEKGLVAPARIQALGDFSYTSPRCEVGTADLSITINDEVKRLGGNAVTRFVIEVQPHADCIWVRAHGVVVKVGAAG